MECRKRGHEIAKIDNTSSIERTQSRERRNEFKPRIPDHTRLKKRETKGKACKDLSKAEVKDGGEVIFRQAQTEATSKSKGKSSPAFLQTEIGNLDTDLDHLKFVE